jgi:hypothetical protein
MVRTLPHHLVHPFGTLLRKTATQIASGKAQAPVAIDLDLVRDALGPFDPATRSIEWQGMRLHYRPGSSDPWAIYGHLMKPRERDEYVHVGRGGELFGFLAAIWDPNT